jgi:hypothetical protein
MSTMCELESLFCNFDIQINSDMSATVFKVIGEATLTENSGVADTALCTLINESLGFALKAHTAKCYPLIIEPTYGAARKHWDDCTRSSAFLALQVCHL